MKQTITAIALHHPDENPLYSESVTLVSLDDEGAGPFITITQSGECAKTTGTLSFSIEELRTTLGIAEQLIKQTGL